MDGWIDGWMENGRRMADGMEVYRCRGGSEAEDEQMPMRMYMGMGMDMCMDMVMDMCMDMDMDMAMDMTYVSGSAKCSALQCCVVLCCAVQCSVQCACCAMRCVCARSTSERPVKARHSVAGGAVVHQQRAACQGTSLSRC